MARPIFRGDRAQSQRANVGPVGKLRLGQHLRPGKNGRTREQRRHVASAIDRRDMESVGEPVAGQRTGERDHVPAIDQPAAETALGLGKQVEVDARIVLVKPRGHLVFGFFDRHPVDVVDLFADVIVVIAIGAAGKGKIISRDIERRARIADRADGHPVGKARHMIRRRERVRIALLQHHPADIFERLAAVVLEAGSSDEHDAGLAARIFLHTDDLGYRVQRIAGIDRGQKVAGNTGVA